MLGVWNMSFLGYKGRALLPYAAGIFEKSEFEEQIIKEGIFAGEDELKYRWKNKISEIIKSTELVLSDWGTTKPMEGGRKGIHTEHLQPLLNEMGEVFRTDPSAEW